jgi:YjbE family integral membrane protein
VEFLSASWWSALAAIVVIDLVLAGDNAIVIALAARKLPAHLRGRAIVWGTVGAILARVLMTLGVVWLLRIPGLMLLGGLALLWIAYRLLADTDTRPGTAAGTPTFWGAMKTIVVADALMGIDNVLGVAGAAHGEFGLVATGLALSVPIVVAGSTLVLRLIERFAFVLHLGAAVLAYTAAAMIVHEPLLHVLFAERVWAWLACAAAVAGVLAAGEWRRRGAMLRR